MTRPQIRVSSALGLPTAHPGSPAFGKKVAQIQGGVGGHLAAGPAGPAAGLFTVGRSALPSGAVPGPGSASASEPARVGQREGMEAALRGWWTSRRGCASRWAGRSIVFIPGAGDKRGQRGCRSVRRADPERDRVREHAARRSRRASGTSAAPATPSIQGFATDISVDQGQTVHFKIDTDATDYRLDIYRLGYYGGDGARKVATVQPSAALPQNQPACLTTRPTTGLVDCGNWAVSASWAVPADAVSGIYFAKLVREDESAPARATSSSSSATTTATRTCCSRPPTRPGRPTTTTAATASTSGSPAGRAYKVSYNRPFTTRGADARGLALQRRVPDGPLAGAQRLRRQLLHRRRHRPLRRRDPRAQGLPVGRPRRVLVGGQRANVEAARDAGVNLAFFSGNEVFWKTRWETASTAGTPPHAGLLQGDARQTPKIDPLADVWTAPGATRASFNPRRRPQPENALTGTIFTVNCWHLRDPGPGRRRQDALLAQHERRRPGRRADARRSPTARSATSGTRTSTTARGPPGLVRLSSTTVNVPQRLLDYGSTYGPGDGDPPPDAVPRTQSGALVFGAGTVQWSWGLDGTHDRGATPSARPAHAAGDGQPARRHGRAAGHAPARPRGRDGLDRHDRPDARRSRRRPTAPSVESGQADRRSPAPRPTPAAAWSAASRSRSTAATTWHPADGRENWTYTWTPRRDRQHDDQDAARPTTAATSRAPAPG